LEKNKKYKRDGLIGTILFHVALLILFMSVGLPYTVPKPEQGILVNFGTTDMGLGDVNTETPGPNDEPTPTENVATTTEAVTQESPAEDVMTDETSDMAVDAAEEPTQTTTEEPVQTQEEPQEEVVEPEPEKQVDQRITNAANLFGQPGGGQSEGDTQGEGNMGEEGGVQDDGAYTGGGGGNGNYKLGGRGVLQSPKYKPNCPEEGKVVMRIKVDNTGKTISAEATRGTTNYAECLVRAAKKSALETRWEPRSDSPLDQVGEITYYFVPTK
jgi:hypothetical protein